MFAVFFFATSHAFSKVTSVTCDQNKADFEGSSRTKILYGFNQFVGHGSRRVPDVPKFGPCHGSRRGPDERSERDT